MFGLGCNDSKLPFERNQGGKQGSREEAEL